MGHAKRVAEQTGGGGAAPYSMEALESRTLLSLVAIHDVEFPSDLVPYNDHLYFVANGAGPGSALYRTDGTPQGLEIVKSSGVWTLGLDAPLIRSGNLLFFQSYDSVSEQTSIWRTDGTSNGTFSLFTTDGRAYPRIASANGVTYIVPHSDRRDETPLWKTDGTVSGTSVVASDFLEGSRIDAIVSFNGKAFFTAFMPIPNQSRYAPVLVGTDGTAGGTNVIYTFKYDAYVSRFETPDVTSNLLVAGDTMYFDYPVRQGTWTSRGTSQTTLPLQLTVGGRLRRYARTPLSMEQVGDKVLILDTSYGWHLANTTTSVELSGNNFRTWNDEFYLTRHPSNDVAEIVRYGSQSWTPVTQVVLRDGGSPPAAAFVARLGQTTYFGASGNTAEDEYNYMLPGTLPLQAAQGTPQNIVEVDMIPTDDPILFKSALFFVTQKHVYRLEASKGTVSGWVYRDQEGETAISSPFVEGANVYADLNRNGAYDSGEPFDISSSTGAYRFEVAPGSYDIRVAGPSSTWNTRARPVTVPTSVAANQLKMVHFGIDDFAPTARIAGRVHRDLNKNGSFETGEGFSKVQIYLDTNNNGKWETTEPWRIPDANGNYEFTGLVGGIYWVRHIYVRDWDLGEYDTFEPNPAARVQAAANTTVTRDFQVLRKQKVTGVFFHDRNADGIRQSDEPALGNQSLRVSVFAQKQGNMGIFNAVVAQWTVKSNAKGEYQANIHVQKYAINPSAPINWRASSGVQLDGLGLDGGIATNDIGLTTLALVHGQLVIEQGGWVQNPEDINGWRVFLDLDLDGKWSSSEPTALTTISTSPRFHPWSAEFSLPPVARGTYTVRLIPKMGYQMETPVFVRVSVGHGGVAWMNFQATATWTVQGIVSNDANSNGWHDDGEIGVKGAKVFFDQNEDGLLTAGEPSALTSASGQYSLKGVLGTSATIACIPPAGWRTLHPPLTAAPWNGGVGEANFAISNTAYLDGLIIEDVNGNGKEDDGESLFYFSPVPEWKVWVDLDKDGLPDPDEPSAGPYFLGTFQIDHVPAGKHILRLRLNTDQVVPTSSMARTITVGPGTTIINLRFTARLRR